MNISEFLEQRIDINAANPDGLTLGDVIGRILRTTVAIILGIAAPLAFVAGSGWFACYATPPRTMTRCNLGIQSCVPPPCYCNCSPWISNHPCYKQRSTDIVCVSCP